MSSTDEAITKLYRVRKTVLQMLNDRGYLVEDDEINMTKEQFVDKFGEHMKREDLLIQKEMRNNPSDKILVFFVVPEPKKNTIGVKVIKECFEKMTSENALKAIVVAEYALTHSANSSRKEFLPRIIMETFQDAELMNNIMEHELVPEHQVLTDVEKKALLQKYKVQENGLPRMLASDPVARHFGLTRGQIVRIIRQSETVSKYVTYRYVC